MIKDYEPDGIFYYYINAEGKRHEMTYICAHRVTEYCNKNPSTNLRVKVLESYKIFHTLREKYGYTPKGELLLVEENNMLCWPTNELFLFDSEESKIKFVMTYL